MIKSMTQKEITLRHMERFTVITTWDAFKDYGIMRLGSVIHILRDEGYDIKTSMKSVTNRFGEKTAIAEYRLSDTIEQLRIFDNG